MFRDGDGLLTCPDEGDGLAPQELSKLNAEGAQEYASSRITPRSGRIDTDDGSVTPVQRTTLEDIESQ